MKSMIKTLQKSELPNDHALCTKEPPPNRIVEVVWNGQVPNTDGGRTSQSCLLETPLSYNNLDNACPCPFNPPGHASKKRQSDDDGEDDEVCPLPGNGGGSIDDLPVPGPIDWDEGEASPTCTANCGNACDGFWCLPQPTGTPPDHEDPDPPEEPEEPEDPNEPDEPEPEPDYEKADPSKNEKSCYNSGQKSNYGSIIAAADSFCRSLGNDAAGPVFHEFYKEDTKQPSHDYHFSISFEVFRGCEWEYSLAECMKYMNVPIDSCDCSQKGDKQGGRVANNCIAVRLDPNHGA